LWAEKQEQKCRGESVLVETLNTLGEKVDLKIGAKFLKDKTEMFVFYQCTETNLWVKELGLLKLDERCTWHTTNIFKFLKCLFINPAICMQSSWNITIFRILYLLDSRLAST
jgi:hypothetical protein